MIVIPGRAKREPGIRNHAVRIVFFNDGRIAIIYHRL
jgi:hypothetical protein